MTFNQHPNLKETQHRMENESLFATRASNLEDEETPHGQSIMQVPSVKVAEIMRSFRTGVASASSQGEEMRRRLLNS